MLFHSFIHIPSIGKKTELKLWNQGFTTLKDVFNSDLSDKIKIGAKTSYEKLQDKDISFFYQELPSPEHWRIFNNFKNSVAYLDIETTGLSYNEIITTIALYDGNIIKHYVNGKNLEDFKKDIIDYDMIITYNGKCFDIPFIESYFKISITNAHLDLRYILKSLGYSGGLKLCEKQLGIDRKHELNGVDGFFAVLLWRYYKKYKDNRSLDTLLSYNIEDVLSLELLMIKAYNEKISQLSFDLDPISLPIQIENPFNPNKMIVYKIKKEFQIYGNSYLTKHQSRQEEKSHIKVKQDTKEIAYIIPHLESTEDYTDTRNLPSKSKNPWLYAKSKFGDYPEPTENSGKWLIFVERKDIDKIWEKIRKWLIAGLLSKYAKVSTVSKLKPSNKTSHVICVFTYDWTDEKDVMDIRKKLRDIGFTQKIPYKTDKDTRKGKYHSGYSTQISKYFE